MKRLFLGALLLSATAVFGQRTITLTEDLVLTETLLITEDVTYVGDGSVSIICDGCSPAVRVENGATVNFRGIRFPKVYARWISVQNGSEANWSGGGMTGYIRTN